MHKRNGGPPKGLSSIKKGTIKRLFGYLSNYKLRLILVIICILFSAVTSVASSLFLQSLIDDYITPMLQQSTPDFLPLLTAILKMAALFVAGAVAMYLYNRIMVTVAQGTIKKIRTDMFNAMQNLPIKYFDQHSNGDIMSHYTNDVDTLNEAISQGFPQVISSIINIVAIFVAMVSKSICLTLVVLLFTVIMMIVMAFVAKKSGSFYVSQQKSLGKVNGFIEELVTGQKVVKVFCHEEKSKRDFENLNQQLNNDMISANKYANAIMPVTLAIGYMMYVALAVIGGVLALNNVSNIFCFGLGTFTLGIIATFLQLGKNFTTPITQVAQQANSIVMAMAGADRIFTLMDEVPEIDNGQIVLVNADEKDGMIIESNIPTGMWAWKVPKDNSYYYVKLEGDIILENVDFEYIEGKQILHDISVYARPGQKVAFVGATGAGKTTITNLINRFYDIADGKIRYDGININKIKKSDLRKSLGIVLQDVNLFTGTVLDNIRYGNLEASDEDCIYAAKLSHAHDFIEMLPNGYNTVLTGDGGGLSQGQRQLISIARAMVANPPVMILDEATSSIDTRTEKLIQRGMDNLMYGRTVFVIAHRLSTVQNSDVIMVLDHGKIIEKGNHEELLAKKDVYYKLYTGAFELE